MHDLPSSHSQIPAPACAPPRARRRSILAAAGIVAAAAAMTATTAMSPPEPEPIPRRWQLDIDVGPLRVATFDIKDQGRQAYFYLTYTVTNNSGEDLLFAPSFELAMDHQVLRSGRQIPLDVTRQLLDQTQIPQIEDQISIIGQLLQGKENAKHGLVVWPAKELSTLHLTLYAAGFSGETATVERPDNNEKVVLRKTLMVRYASPGDLNQNGQEPIPTAEPSRWIMR
jgi:hypothetical protein